MAWLSISLLIISITYLTYQHPPTTWTPILRWFRSAKRQRGIVNTREEQIESINTSEEPKEKKQDRSDEKKDTRQGPHDDVDGDATPLANPTSMAVPVPSFTLDDSHTAAGRDSNSDDQRPQEEEEKEEDEDEDARDNLPPPVFPAPNSAQRASALRPPTTMAPPPPLPQPPKPTPGLMAPPVVPASRTASSLMPPPSRPATDRQIPAATSSLRVPSTGPLPNRGPPASSGAQARGPPPSSLSPARIDTPNSRNKVQLTPGHSPLDWATLARSENLSNVPRFLRVTPSMLKHFHGRKDKETGLKKDAWSVYQGKVYNITPYLPFHPGGEGELLRGAGKDGTALFNDVHPWVNWEGMLTSCLVGILVAESEETSGLESLD
ncbi:hypothetical protein AAFC00_007159 [Neodothiora populina]|uniref:Cytochrome b5 heme-binding domain-containing protein n=2 Tax=Neodothiora populina TaxID=2781224 RepID=A0ABR3PHC5_9PEZI